MKLDDRTLRRATSGAMDQTEAEEFARCVRRLIDIADTGESFYNLNVPFSMRRHHPMRRAFRSALDARLDES